MSGVFHDGCLLLQHVYHGDRLHAVNATKLRGVEVIGGGNVQVAYEYGYGCDGGRRWRKDYVNGVWTRYPCGVACGAGDLVEQEKPLEGGQ